jgi:O-antigen chain-terminating methyltransferase
MPERLEETLRRLKQERDEADRRYNDALTELDRAHAPGFQMPRPPRGYDDHQLTALNQNWQVIGATGATGATAAAAARSGVKARIADVVYRAMAPYLQRQHSFNSLLVDHLNRSVDAARAAQRASEEAATALQAKFDALANFNGRLLLYLQQITGYVDTKDRDTASGALILNASVSGMAENLDKRWESLNARLETRTAALASTQESLRTSVSVAQQASVTLKRELERLQGSDRSQAEVRPGTDQGQTPFAPALDAYKYLTFEDRFRGSRAAIGARLESYLPHFAGASDVLDVGCGRGEFLDLLRASGVSARGIDLNHEMAEHCRARGLDVTEGDAVSYLSAQPDESLGGIFAAQVVEHLQPSYLLRFLELTFLKLRPGGVMVLETLNPACWVAFFDSYIRDITHVWPLHPDTLKYLVIASGFTRVDVEYRSPVPEEDKLQPLPTEPGALPRDLVEAFNENVRKLNARMFTNLDYAVVGVR